MNHLSPRFSPLFVLSILALGLMAVGCRTVSVSSAPPIMVPEGLSVQEVKLAVLSAVYPEKAPREWTPMEQMTDNALRAAFGFNYTRASRQGTWFVEEVRPASVVVGYERGKYYFRVELLIEKGRIVQRIDGSRNLSQSEGEIHKAVFEWLGPLESKIRQSMGTTSALKAAAGLK